MTTTPEEFTKDSHSPKGPADCPENIVRRNEQGEDIATVYFKVWTHHMDWFVVGCDDDDEVAAQGCLKWDGCMNFDIGSGINGCMAHACGPASLRMLLSHVEWIYTLGNKIPAWDASIAAKEMP